MHDLPEKLKHHPLISGGKKGNAPQIAQSKKGRSADGTSKDYMTEVPIKYFTSLCVGFTAAFTVPLALKVAGLL